MTLDLSQKQNPVHKYWILLNDLHADLVGGGRVSTPATCFEMYPKINMKTSTGHHDRVEEWIDDKIWDKATGVKYSLWNLDGGCLDILCSLLSTSLVKIFHSKFYSSRENFRDKILVGGGGKSNAWYETNYSNCSTKWHHSFPSPGSHFSVNFSFPSMQLFGFKCPFLVSPEEVSWGWPLGLVIGMYSLAKPI